MHTRLERPGNKEAGAPRTVHRSLAHDSAERHVAGSAAYLDDLREPEGTLHVAPGGSPVARGRVKKLDLSAVHTAPGVVAVITAADIPGHNNIGAIVADEPLFADSQVVFHGQPLFAAVATSYLAARRAAMLAKIEIEAEQPLITIEDGLKAGSRVLDDYDFIVGDAPAAIAASPHRVKGTLHIGGQEHFYLEGQAALAIPGEAGEMHIHSSTQHPSEVQHIVAHLLDVQQAAVTVEVRRMGGAFGGKESQATQWAAMAALAAHVTRRPCKLRLDRDSDMAMTGKRHDFRADYDVGFDDEGRILGYGVQLAARCGHSVDLSPGVVDRAMFHADNAYHFATVSIRSKRLKTNTVSNTAFRGFGGPQGMMAVERAIDAIAWKLGQDPLDVRIRNFYGPGRDMTPYGMKVADNVLPELVSQLEKSSDYRSRRKEIAAYNDGSRFLRRGIALTPVKFGISFTIPTMNQAGALVHVYRDGSIHLNHGGTEMGQGLFVKVAQVVAEAFGVSLERVKITPTHTGKVPNTSPTAASAGSDINGMAALAAANTIKDRITDFAADHYNAPRDQIRFRDDEVMVGNRVCAFEEIVEAAYRARVQLSATGFYATPTIDFDRAKAWGRPFYYFAYGAACSEVMIDTTTGEMRILRADLLHDVGRSLNPAVDLGQIEGGFVQGAGWLTSEELVFDNNGRLTTHAPSTYKIPTAFDVPEDFRVAFFENENREETIWRSKAVGEPPLMLAISVFAAIADAIHSVKPGSQVPLDAPATPEAILRAVKAARGH
ncbi:MAG TPA: xanthine dehydrogenase molybdopterin binding subunit [Xanthobacteraceae bacterium]|nr:xanthine dehydrogenase molybdopterin binding subunit [Xanthobacteraceae bacterium]